MVTASKIKTSPLAVAFPQIPPVGGVRFSVAQAGIKTKGRDDVTLIQACAGANIAGVFTQSATRSAAVLDCQAKLAKTADSHAPLAIVINSGNANAFTGARGEQTVADIVSATAKTLNTEQNRVFTASTGVIGEPLDARLITATLPDLHANLNAKNAESVARAIMTTDTFAKGAVRQITLNGQRITIAGFAKGSGMIAPDMATMLGYIFTDARIEQPKLQAMLAEATATSFNAISVDGDTSTSDTVMMIATGAAGADASDNAEFRTALRELATELAHLIVKDGEGATKFITVKITGATSDSSAKLIAQSIANSPLVKTAIAGEDPNWGRIVMAVGKAGQPADRDKLRIWFGDILVAQNGAVSPDYREADAAAYMQGDHITLAVDLGLGDGAFTMWACDFTDGYIRINADYRS